MFMSFIDQFRGGSLEFLNVRACLLIRNQTSWKKQLVLNVQYINIIAKYYKWENQHFDANSAIY